MTSRQKNFAVLIIIVVLVIISCARGPDIVVETVVVQITTTPQPSNTPLPTDTPTTTPTQTPTASPTITPKKSPTRTATQTPEEIGNGISSGIHGIEGEYVSFPTLGVQLFRPEDYIEAENYYGIEDPETGSSVMIVSVPAPFSELKEGFTPEMLGTRDVELIGKEDVLVDNLPGVLIWASQTAYRVDFKKWILIFGDEKSTSMVVANYPEMLENIVGDLLKAVVLSAKPTEFAQTVEEPENSFTIIASNKMKPEDPGPVKNVLVFSMSDPGQSNDPTAPFFIAAPSLSDVPIQNQRQFAVDRLYDTVETRIAAIRSNQEVNIDGLDGYEIIADGEVYLSNIPMVIYQVMLFDGDSYYLMQGLVGRHLAEEYLPEFKAMAESFKRR